MITERRIRTGAFLVGVLLYFTLKTAVESVFPYGKPLINLPQQLGFNILLSFLINLILGIGTQRINDGLEEKIPWQEAATRRLVVQAVVTGLFVLVMVSLFASVMIFVILPYRDPVESFIRAIVVGSVFAMVMSMFYTAVYFYEQWGRSRLEAEQLKRENLQSQFLALKNQVSPHFLFNSLSTLGSLIPEDQKRASAFVQNLASVYRYVLQSMDREVVPLETELQAARAYIFLQQTRFGESLQVCLDFPDASKRLGIVPFTLQLLLENAIKHNIVSNERPLTIWMSVEDGNRLVVKNNLQRKQSVESGEGVGLRNIVKRYDLLGEADVMINETETEFVVTLPLLKDGRL